MYVVVYEGNALWDVHEAGHGRGSVRVFNLVSSGGCGSVLGWGAAQGKRTQHVALATRYCYPPLLSARREVEDSPFYMSLLKVSMNHEGSGRITLSGTHACASNASAWCPTSPGSRQLQQQSMPQGQITYPLRTLLLQVMRDASTKLSYLATGSSSGSCSSGSGSGGGDDGSGGGQDGAMEGVHGGAAAAVGPQSGSRAGGEWRALRRLVVYGLGSPHESRVSRYQVRWGLVLPAAGMSLPLTQRHSSASSSLALHRVTHVQMPMYCCPNR